MRVEIKAIQKIHYANRDRAGNCYYAFEFTDCRTGKMVCGKLGTSSSSFEFAQFIINGGEHANYKLYTTREGHNTRSFESMKADWPYAGGTPEQIATFILARLPKGFRKRFMGAARYEKWLAGELAKALRIGK